MNGADQVIRAPSDFIDPADVPPAFHKPVNTPGEVEVPLGQAIGHRYCLGDREQIAQNGGILPLPQAFLVELPGQSSVSAHFHPIDQFQVFFPATGAWYQRTPIDELLIHYADAFSTYGPFGSSGSNGLEFYTLRAFATLAVGYMPRDRASLPHRGRRNYHVAFTPDRIPSTGEVNWVSLIGPEDDGLAISVFYGGAGAGFSPDIAGGGQYHCVLAGSVSIGTRSWGPPAIAWRPPNVPCPTYRVEGETGCVILVMQFPTPNVISSF